VNKVRDLYHNGVPLAFLPSGEPLCHIFGSVIHNLLLHEPRCEAELKRPTDVRAMRWSSARRWNCTEKSEATNGGAKLFLMDGQDWWIARMRLIAIAAPAPIRNAALRPIQLGKIERAGDPADRPIHR
jgi:hypothetical protein